jgi:hypothetical protein
LIKKKSPRVQHGFSSSINAAIVVLWADAWPARKIRRFAKEFSAMRDARGEAGAPKLLRSYGRRKGKPLSARKERLITELLPRLRLNLKEPPPRDLFSVPVKEVWLEIGFGSGEHLLWQAEQHQDIGFIGCEPFVNGMGSLLGAVADRGIATIRSMTATPATCSLGSPMALCRGSSSSSPILGRRSGS